jgi:hypothetical protein
VIGLWASVAKYDLAALLTHLAVILVLNVLGDYLGLALAFCAAADLYLKLIGNFFKIYIQSIFEI